MTPTGQVTGPTPLGGHTPQRDAAEDGAWLASLAAPDRLRAIAEYDLFNPELLQRLDEVSRRTAKRLGTPTALVSVVLDTAVYHAGRHGVSGWIATAGGTPIEWGFCARAILSGQPVYVVPDAGSDPAWRDNPLVGEGMRTYAGVPLVTPGGRVLGTHCVIAGSPREFTAEELAALRAAADEVMAILDAYRVGQLMP